ncbi:MAG TPA: hypothetical protein VN618_08200 [Solirubrobacteraceae bacterium]|nr:hypothetical protein [Solirubrobacteraceae bacterium]
MTHTERDLRRRRTERRRRRTRARAAGGAVAAVALGVLALTLFARSGGRVAHTSTATRRVPVAAPSNGVAATRRSHAHSASARLARAVAREARRPQTHDLPSTHGALFGALMRSLWRGVVSGRARPALVAFFPKAAYVRLKAIYGAASDWQSRLVRDYALDLAAAHRLLGTDAAHARLVGVRARSAYGHWIPPGVCSNDIGYYEMPDARVIYRERGATRSFGIASMISWRGEWYVVHLGAILRTGEGGVLDTPAIGPGAQVPSSTC